MFAAGDHTDAVIDAYMALYRYDTQISTYYVSDSTSETSKLQNCNPKSSHNEPQARQYRMVIPMVNDVFRAHVFCFHSQAPATSSPFAGVLPPRMTFVCRSKLFASRIFLSMGCHGTSAVKYLMPDFSTVSLTTKQIISCHLDPQSSHQQNQIHRWAHSSVNSFETLLPSPAQ